MAQQKNGVIAVTGLIMVVLAVSIMAPAMAIALDSPQTDTLDQTESERIVLTGSITTEAVTIETQPSGFVNISIVDEQNGDVAFSGDISEGETRNITISGDTVGITVLEIVSSTEAILQYEYPTYLGYPPNASVIFENLVLFIILSTFLMVAGVLAIVGGVFTNG